MGTQQRRSGSGSGRKPPHGVGAVFYTVVSLVAFFFRLLDLKRDTLECPIIGIVGCERKRLLCTALKSAGFLFGVVKPYARYQESKRMGWSGLGSGSCRTFSPCARSAALRGPTEREDSMTWFPKASIV